MKINFTGVVAWGAVKPGRLAFDVDKNKTLREAVHKLHAAEQKRGEPYVLSLSMEIQYRRKTNLQLATYYSLCKILAVEWNGGKIGPDMIDEEHVDAALKQQVWWPTTEIPTKGIIPKLKRKMTTVELAGVIDAIFDELSQMGLEVTTPEEIGTYWQQWRQLLNDEGIILNAEVEYTAAAYKEAIGCCEACGKYLRDGGGSLAHIKSKGVGGDPSEGKTFRPTERMFLCDPCHASFDNGRGRSAFLSDYPHLRHKIEQGLGKAVAEAVDIFDGELQ